MFTSFVIGLPARQRRGRGRGLSTLALMVALGAALVAVPAVASATAPYPPTSSCALSTISGSGDHLTVHGSGFAADVTVQLRLQSSGASLGSATTGADGTFDTAVSVPSTVASSDRITATAGGRSCSFEPFSNGPKDNSSNGSTGDTASTGFQTLTATLIAAGLLVGGIVLVMLGRRRRTG